MSDAELRPEIRAALLCDIPALYRFGAAGRAFAEVLNLRVRFDDDPASADEPLMIAARGLAAELAGRLDEAAQSYTSLLTEALDASLLGHAFLAWMPTDDPRTPIEAAASMLDAVQDAQVKAHYLCRLMTFALDRGLRDLGERYYERALALADATSGLREVLHIVGWNIFRKPLTSLVSSVHRDDLVELPWIDEVASRGMRETVSGLVRGMAADPWSFRIKFTQGEFIEPAASELQALWAGAIWLLPTVRQQFGAQMLLKVEQLGPEQSAHAASMWILGGGDDIAEVVDLVEPRFDSSSADELLRTHLIGGRRLGAETSYIETGLAVWDVVSDELAAVLLDDLELLADDHPDADRARDLFNLLGLRVPARWLISLKRQQPAVQDRVLAQIQPTIVTLIAERDVRELFPLLVAQWRNSQHAVNCATACVMLADRLVASPEAYEVDALINTAPAPVRVILFQRTQSERTRPRAVDVEALATDVERMNAEALKGSQGIGSYNLRALLGLAAWQSNEAAERGIAVVVETASDPRLPSDFRLDAIRSLYNLSISGRIDAERIAVVAQSPASSQPSIFGNVTPDLVECGMWMLRSSIDVDGPVRSRLAVFLRHPDTRVRHLAVAALGRMLGPDETFVGSLIASALFDPSEDVVTEALAAVRKAPALDDASAPVVVLRLTELFETGRRKVRQAAGVTARDLLRRDPNLPLESLVTAAASDRSWQVRQALAADPAESQDTSGV